MIEANKKCVFFMLIRYNAMAVAHANMERVDIKICNVKREGRVGFGANCYIFQVTFRSQ